MTSRDWSTESDC